MDRSVNVLLAYDEGDQVLVDATMAVAAQECEATGSTRLGDDLVDKWFGHRNDVAALESYISKGFVVDTLEISAPWSALRAIYTETIAAMSAVPGSVLVSAHQSHSYPTGACLYFTFGGMVAPDERDAYYTAVWDAGTRTVLANGGSLSHHHGVGMNRARFMPEALKGGFGVLAAIKATLDPNGVCNPGKLGLPDAFGGPGWPAP